MEPPEREDRPREFVPDGNRCLITLDQEPLECCHVISVATSQESIQRLEHAWGFGEVEEKLNIHTVQNLIWLRTDMHTRFDHLDWALVPTRSTLNSIFTATALVAPGKAPPHYQVDFPDTTWNYHFVLFRRSPVAFLRFQEDMESFDTYRYPFSDFGPIISHVHPYFAIVNAAQKELHHRENASYLSDSPNSPPSRSPDYKKPLEICVLLYQNWMSQNPAPLLGPPPRKRTREESALTCAHSLPAPKQSRKDTCSLGSRVETAVPKAERLVRIKSWAEDVKASEPLEDPHDTHSEPMDHCLTRYRGEFARRPRGPWEKWVPDYGLV
ncbi:hypothetical protein FRC10_011333 [Ceratobasidium sp. 414]|nr:hypothetical protein FRC10_011333 [Ceratobasidium sp. 414]